MSTSEEIARALKSFCILGRQITQLKARAEKAEAEIERLTALLRKLQKLESCIQSGEFKEGYDAARGVVAYIIRDALELES